MNNLINVIFAVRHFLRNPILKCIYNNESPFKCNICNTSFAWKSSLTQHLNAHDNEKPFKCNICSMSFSQKYGLNTHLSTHNNSKPSKCNTCTK